MIITAGLYTYQFGSLNLSDKEQDWVSFSDYFSGILNPILALLNLIILTYLTIKIVKIESDRNTWTLQELARPYANLLTENTEYSIDISIHNLGLGPMIITDFKLYNDAGNIFNNFYDLVSYIDSSNNLKFVDVNPKIDSFEINSENGGAIGKDQSHSIFKFYYFENNNYNKEYIEFIREQLNNYTLSISYNDLYKRNIDCMKEKLRFKPWE